MKFNLFEKDISHKYPDTYEEELARQCARMIPWLSLGTLQWLMFIPSDTMVFPEMKILPYLRVGLPITTISVFIIYLFKPSDRKAYIAGLIGMSYLQCVTGFITGLTNAEPVYVAGYSIVLMMMIIMPIRKRDAYFILILSLAIFASFLIRNNYEISDRYKQYNLSNLFAAAFVSFLMVYLADKIRLRSYQKGMALNIEREKNEKLLLNILPPDIADKLKSNPNEIIAEKHEEIAVLFADVVNFTVLSKQLNPEDLVKLLNHIFTNFDSICERNSLEKIKTIRDAYMAISGAPIFSPDFVENAIRAASEMLGFVRSDALCNQYGLSIRIGLNKGPVVAGVIGKTKFVYDLWGDTVNVASRMESHGARNLIQITETFYHEIKGQYEFESRGEMAIKGLGNVRTYTFRP